MKDIKEYLVNESHKISINERNHTDEQIQQYVEVLNLEGLKDVNVELSENVIKRCAGYIVEEYVKVKIKFFNGSVSDTFVDGDYKEWYDFELDGDKFEVKAFLKGKKYSNTKLTKNQIEHKNELIFIFAEYTIDGTKIKLNSVSIEDGSTIKINQKDGRVLKK